jgi:hypothetical protein
MNRGSPQINSELMLFSPFLFPYRNRLRPIPADLQAPSIIQGPQYSHLQNGSRGRSASDADRTPRQSPQSPSGELDQAETQLIQDVIASRRSSYALPPSPGEQEVVGSHFHDMDLCILLHQLDERHTHEVVKKALRKAIRQRVKKLGLKYDPAVSILITLVVDNLVLISSNSQLSSTGIRSTIMIPEFTLNPTISQICLMYGNYFKAPTSPY